MPIVTCLWTRGPYHNAAAQAPDILEDFDAFRHYDRRGINVRLEYYHAAILSTELKDSVFGLCKENMETAYASAWGWNDVAKRKELQSPGGPQLLYIGVLKPLRETLRMLRNSAPLRPQ